MYLESSERVVLITRRKRERIGIFLPSIFTSVRPAKRKEKDIQVRAKRRKFFGADDYDHRRLEKLNIRLEQ